MRKIMVLMIVVLLVGLTPAATFAAPVGQAGCQDVPKLQHHTLGWSKYWGMLTSSGTVKAFKATGDVIVYVRLSECAGKYLIGIWRGGKFVTHFITSWGYVQGQIAGATASSWGSVVVQRMFLIVLIPCAGTWDRFAPCGGSNE